MSTANVLIIDDEASICWGLSNLCSNLSFNCVTASSAERGLELAHQQSFDLIIMDVRLPGIDGITAIKDFKSINLDLPVITITAFGELSTAIDAIQNGAFEYIVKPFDLKKVQTTIQQAVATKRLSESLDTTSQQPDTPISLANLQQPRLIGSSALMQEVFKQIALTTTSNAPVLIVGERGTGKELTARSIHQFGPNSDGPFVTANVAGINPANIETTIFGDSSDSGALHEADGGTLFIDDIADLPLEAQLKLLRLLESNDIKKLASGDTKKQNFRLISATHQDLLSQINHGDFRHDFFYLLRTFEIKIPPLRNRLTDIPELVEYFVKRSTNPSISPTKDFISRLQSMTWTDNIRQLKSVVQSAVTRARGGLITSEHIDSQITDLANHRDSDKETQLQQLVAEWTRAQWNDNPESPLYDLLIAIIDSAILPQAFQLSENQYSAAARRLGIHRTTLKRKLDELHSEQNDKR